MKKEKFVIRPVAGGFATVADDPKACPLLERLWAGPVDEKVETTDTLAQFVAHIRSVAKGMGVTALVCGDRRHAPTVILWEKRRAQRVPKPRRGWINTLADVAAKLYEIEAEGLDERNDKDARTLADAISHRVYKYTNCGAWLNLVRERFDPAVGTVPARHAGGSLVGVVVGSIVEGIDAETDTHELLFPFTQKRFWAALQAVEDEASDLWNDTHGCETCAKHWHEQGITSGEWGPFEGNDSVTPVWDECPDCGGSGSII